MPFVAVEQCLKESREILELSIRPAYGRLEVLLLPIATPPFYKFSDSWRNVTQKVAFLVSLLIFLEKSEPFASYEDVAKEMNSKYA